MLMRKISLLFVVAFMAVLSWAGTPVRSGKALKIAQEPMTARPFTPTQRVHNMSMTTLPAVKKAPARKAMRKAASIDQLTGEKMLVSYYYAYNSETESLVEAVPAAGATPITITKVDETTIGITGFTSDATDAILATVDLEAGTVSIESGQTLMTDKTYGAILLVSISDDPIVGTIYEDGTIALQAIWYAVLGEGNYKGYMWSNYNYSVIVAPNGTMSWGEGEDAESNNVYIEQDPESPKIVTVYNFGGFETAIDVKMKEDNKFAIENQLVYDYGEEYGEFRTYGLYGEKDNLMAMITGEGTKTALTFSGPWTVYSSASEQWFGKMEAATIALTDGSEFIYPVIPDVAAMPDAPEIVEVGAYDKEEEYGWVEVYVPTQDTEGNELKESNLSYQLFSEKDGVVQPIVFTADLYMNLDDDLTVVPYEFYDAYDFDIYDVHKVIYLNFAFDYDRIGVKSIYTGGGTTNETEIQWFTIEKKAGGDASWVAVEQGYDNAEVVESFDIDENISVVLDKGEGTVDPAYYDKGEALRLYSQNTMTISGGENVESITSIELNFTSAGYGQDISANVGEYELVDATGVWEGDALSVTFTRSGTSGHARIASINVTYKLIGGEESEALVVLPEGVTAEPWAIEGTFNTSLGSSSEQYAAEVAISGSDIYVKGLAFYFKDAWVKGTISGGIASFPSGQFVGEDDYGMEYLAGTDDGETLCDIEFVYDADAKTLTQKTSYILENGEKSELSYYGYWTGLFIYAGEPDIVDPVVAPEGLVTESYKLTATHEVSSEDVEPSVEEYDCQVLVGFDGDDLYIQGIVEDLSEGWVKATKNAQGEYVIPANQYMGKYEDFFSSYDLCLTSVDGEGNLTDIVLAYNADTNTFTTAQPVVINCNKRSYDPYDILEGVTITKMSEFVAVPATPAVASFDPDDKYPSVEFDIPAKSENGEDLLMTKLFYQIYIVKNGAIEPLTLTADLYDYIEEDMTVIPYNYDDGYDIYKGGSLVFLNQPEDEIASWTNIGVQTIYTGGGETKVSPIAWYMEETGNYEAEAPLFSKVGYATYSSTQALDLSAAVGVKAYIATQVEGNTITMKKVTGVVPANTGLLLQKDGTEEALIPVATTSAEPLTDNLLVAVVAPTTIPASTSGSYRYVFAIEKNASIPDFYLVEEPTLLPANKAYLFVNEKLAASRLNMVFDDSAATGIDTVAADQAERALFNLSGQRVASEISNVKCQTSNLKKGLYIENGKKVVIK